MGREALLRALREARRDIEPGQEVSLGLFRPEDAPGIAQAYYEAYGDAFPLDFVYDPEEIVRRNATKDQHTMVVRTPRGEVVGLFGLFRSAPNPEVYEAGQLIVLAGYRNRNVGSQLSRPALDELPRRFGIPVLFLEAVGNSAASQHLAQARGMVFTGLEVECMPPNPTATGSGAGRNVSLFLMFKTFAQTALAVHLPETCRPFCEAIYARLSLPRSLAPSGPLSGETEANRVFLPEVGLSRLTVTRAGADFAGQVAAAEAQSGERGMVQVFLNLGDAAAPAAEATLRARGYFLAGLLPCWFGSDGLLLQRVGREPDWEAIQVCSPEAAAMRDTIREDFARAKSEGSGSV